MKIQNENNKSKVILFDAYNYEKYNINKKYMPTLLIMLMVNTLQYHIIKRGSMHGLCMHAFFNLRYHS
jgi:hypothetical protein